MRNESRTTYDYGAGHTRRFSNALTFVFPTVCQGCTKLTHRAARVATGITSRSLEVQPIELFYPGVDGICLAHRLGATMKYWEVIADKLSAAPAQPFCS